MIEEEREETEEAKQERLLYLASQNDIKLLLTDTSIAEEKGESESKVKGGVLVPIPSPSCRGILIYVLYPTDNT